MEKKELIKLWMAQGYLGLEQNKEMEIIGEECFENLVMHSFFQDFQKDSDGNVRACKMHDIVHDFAQFLIKRECFILEINSLEEPSPNSYEKVCHLMLILGNKDASFAANICSVQQLCSLLVAFNSASVCNVLPKLFEQLTCLRALNISITGRYITSIKEIPGEIQKLIHLRYLNMSKLENLTELPELCDLYNLQILDISYRAKLKKLPQGMGKLINLSYLMNDVTEELCYMPKGIERLTCLHTLSKLVLGSRLHGSEACTLECLKNLYRLKGSLELTELEIATNEAEAKQAELSKKENLIRLSLSFGGDIVFVNNEEFPVNDEELIFIYNELLKHDEVILEALEPSPNLENLSLSWYRGNIFPNWMVSLSQLKKLHLDQCMKYQRYRVEKGRDWPRISHIPDIKFDSIAVKLEGDRRRCYPYTSGLLKHQLNFTYVILQRSMPSEILLIMMSKRWLGWTFEKGIETPNEVNCQLECSGQFAKYGYNVATRKYEDLVVADIIDPPNMPRFDIKEPEHVPVDNSELGMASDYGSEHVIYTTPSVYSGTVKRDALGQASNIVLTKDTRIIVDDGMAAHRAKRTGGKGCQRLVVRFCLEHIASYQILWLLNLNLWLLEIARITEVILCNNEY
ncbi:hypothetical protein Ddye_014558 [Dipteronia dyeriana]|uniref:Uncharacterized protein n=1 Tax=Dipteronia dyeriana TaxID=168575 RepID=A0AAE0CKN9_9ROSI|nr:hypothetical protein Ddye_014558 [Dipteronia dyeriana]